MQLLIEQSLKGTAVLKNRIYLNNITRCVDYHTHFLYILFFSLQGLLESLHTFLVGDYPGKYDNIRTSCYTKVDIFQTSQLLSTGNLEINFYQKLTNTCKSNYAPYTKSQVMSQTTPGSGSRGVRVFGSLGLS